MLNGAGSFRPVELGELREPILGWQWDQVVVTWIRHGIADRFSLGQDAKLVSQYCTDLLHTKNSWADGSAVGPVAYFASHTCFSASALEAPGFTNCTERVGLTLSGMYAHV